MAVGIEPSSGFPDPPTAVVLLRTKNEDEQQWGSLRHSQELLQQLDGGGISPVEVLALDYQRAFACGTLNEPLHGSEGAGKTVHVRDIMKRDPVTVFPETSTVKAIETMRRCKGGCLPVVQGDRLIGMVTEREFMDIAAVLLEKGLRSSL